MGFVATLPYVCGLAALGAAWAAASRRPGAGRLLRTLALAALGALAFARGVAPAALSAALVLSALANVASSVQRPAWASGSPVLAFAAWAMFAHLLSLEGLGLSVLLTPAHAAVAVLSVMVAAGFLAALRGAHRLSLGAAAELVALAAMGVFAATLRWPAWEALAGVLCLFAAQGLALLAPAKADEGRHSGVQGLGYWLAAFAGQVAIAHAFLR